MQLMNSNFACKRVDEHLSVLEMKCDVFRRKRQIDALIKWADESDVFRDTKRQTGRTTLCALKQSDVLKLVIMLLWCATMNIIVVYFQ